MRLKAKLLVLAAVPLLLSLALIATAVQLQQRELARREHALVEGGYLSARRAELKNYVQLAMSAIAPMTESRDDVAGSQARAMRVLEAMEYGDDGYFFVYDMHGTVLMHPRQRDLVGKDVGGAGRQYRLTPLDDLARQPKHRRGLAAPSDQRDDIAGGDAQRLGQGRARQPRAPAAARSISSLAPAWIHGKKLVITRRTPRRV